MPAILCICDIYRSRRIRADTNNAKPPWGPEWQSYRRSVSGANCTFVALWMLAILRSRYSRDIRWFVRFLPLCFYSFRKVSNRIHDCPENHRIWKVVKVNHICPASKSLTAEYRILNQVLSLKFCMHYSNLVWCIRIVVRNHFYSFFLLTIQYVTNINWSRI